MIPFEIPWADLLPFIVIGFVAQLIDSALGMAFGLVGTALLMMLGVPPVAASASVHMAESVTGGVSGISHALQRNVDWRLFRRLVVPGIIGGLLGVWLLTNLVDGIIRPVVLVYLGAVGLYLLWRGARRPQTYRSIKFVGTLGLAGGLVDGSGGGGWGPIVNANLLAQGASPRIAIGTVNVSEFFITVTIAAGFVGSLGMSALHHAVWGLLAGGVVAAPIGAYFVRRLPARFLINGVGILLVLASAYGLLALTFEPIPTFPGF
ncbi:MAG: sulfite exporter TauE/SafE family protein [Sphingobium sp.]